jgi:hypothetical protein
MSCENPDHEKFRGVMFAKNGCLACAVEGLGELVEELMEREQARSEGRPMANGLYPHLVICSGNWHKPLGEPGCVCDRRYAKLRAEHEKMRANVVAWGEGVVGTVRKAQPAIGGNADSRVPESVIVMGDKPPLRADGGV